MHFMLLILLQGLISITVAIPYTSLFGAIKIKAPAVIKSPYHKSGSGNISPRMNGALEFPARQLHVAQAKALRTEATVIENQYGSLQNQLEAVNLKRQELLRQYGSAKSENEKTRLRKLLGLNKMRVGSLEKNIEILKRTSLVLKKHALVNLKEAEALS